MKPQRQIINIIGRRLFMKLLNIIGGILIVFAIADFGLSWVGINLTPFLPPAISSFSPIVIGLIGGVLLKANKNTFK